MKTSRFTLATNAAVVLLLVMSVLLFTVPSAPADEAQAKSSGILPLPDYTGDVAKRSYLLGDFGGKRAEWATKGVTFNIDYNQYFQSVTDGGIDRDSEYGGTIDYNINVDFDRMGLIPGGLLQIRAVSRYGNSVNGISGSLIPVNTDATHPTTSPTDEDVGIVLPVINYMQFLSEKYAVGFGKFDTYDSSNEFAGGRGRSQWWNQNLTMPVSPALVIPYSVLGISGLAMPNPDLSIFGLVATSTDTSNRSGFNDLDDGLFALLNMSYQYQLRELPGGLGLMPGFGWDGDFTEINGRINIEEDDFVPTTKNDTWFVSAEIWQYLWTEGAGEQAVDPGNGRQDLQGVGFFSRIQFADRDANPLDYSISGGLNGKGLIPKRDNDCMGIAYAYNGLQSDLLQIIGVDTHSSALELFYTIELSPAVHVTLDAQVVESPLPDVSTATILGASMQLLF